MNSSQRLRVAFLTVSLALRSEAESEPAQPPKTQSDITRALRAMLPKYVPPAPTKPSPASGSEEDDGSAGDVLHLPKITVRPQPFTPESDFALLNPKGRLDLALKTHAGMRVGNVLGLNEIMALTMHQEERLAAKKADLAGQVQRSTLGDSELDQKIRDLMQALLQRSGTERDFPSVYLPPRESRRRPRQ